MQAGVPLRPILLLVALVSPSQAVSCLRREFFVVFFFLFTSSFFLICKGCTAGPPQPCWDTPRQRTAVLWNTHNKQYLLLRRCNFSLALWNLLLFVTLLPLTNATARFDLAVLLLPKLLHRSLPPKTAAAAFIHSGLCLACTKGKNTNTEPPNQPTAALT